MHLPNFKNFQNSKLIKNYVNYFDFQKYQQFNIVNYHQFIHLNFALNYFLANRYYSY
jgi:hypothetical protein